MYELLSSDQMSQADRLTIEAGVSGFTLMERAGKAVADQAKEIFGPDSNILVLCGPGNNGGDGFIAASLLREQGQNIRIALLGKLEQLSGDAALAAKKWSGPIVPLCATELNNITGVIDALFGAGLSRDITGPTADMITDLNDTGIPVLAVDLPSGIDGSTGKIWGVAIKALYTVSFFRRKPGHILLPGREFCGPVEIVDIGIPATVLDQIQPRVFANVPALWINQIPTLKIGDHKFMRGHGVIISGGPDSTGAARLAAQSALRIGAGLVTLASPLDALAINAAQLTSVMVKPFTDTSSLIELLKDKRKNCVVIGPGTGVGKQTREIVLTLLASEKSLVLDADALTSFREQPEQLFEAIDKRSAPTVLTPHDGEYQHLFQAPNSRNHANNGDRLARTRTAAKTSGAIVILKGADTTIGEPDGRAVINDNAPPSLATAGSGDVLAGMVGGLLAQNMPVFEAACAAVWLHGEAANSFGPGLISEDLPNLLPAALGRLFSKSNSLFDPEKPHD